MKLLFANYCSLFQSVKVKMLHAVLVEVEPCEQHFFWRMSLTILDVHDSGQGQDSICCRVHLWDVLLTIQGLRP